MRKAVSPRVPNRGRAIYFGGTQEKAARRLLACGTLVGLLVYPKRCEGIRPDFVGRPENRQRLVMKERAKSKAQSNPSAMINP
jgi:hypothetical protein